MKVYEVEHAEVGSADPDPIASTHSSRFRSAFQSWKLYLVLLPVFVLLGLISYYPAVNGMLHAFYHWRPGFISPFVGLAHFKKMLADRLWWQSFAHIGEIFLWAVTLAWAFPLLAAELIITLSSKRLQFFFRTVLIIPFAFPLVVQLLIWGFMYDPNSGLINTVLRDVGLGFLARNWLGSQGTALISLIFVNFPWVASLPFLIFLAALQNVPKEIFEAATLDGAGRLRRFVSIDLPLLGRQFRLLFVLAIISVLQYGVASAILTNGGPNYATDVPVLHMLNVAFDQSEWGYAAALSTTLFLITLFFSVISLRMRRGPKGRIVRANANA